MDGFGFGVIAQALWMAQTLGGDMDLAEQILLAKKGEIEYSELDLGEDAPEVNNWGQFKKFVLGEEVKSLTNLGAIMSGRAIPESTETPPTEEAPTEEATLTSSTTTTTTVLGNGNGQGGDHGKGKGKGNGHGKGKGH